MKNLIKMRRIFQQYCNKASVSCYLYHFDSKENTKISNKIFDSRLHNPLTFSQKVDENQF